MSFLSDVEIRAVLNHPQKGEDERVDIIPPPDDKHIGPCSIDLRLGHEFARLRAKPRIFGFHFDPRQHQAPDAAQETWYKKYSVTENRGFLLRSNETVIAVTKESVRLPRAIFGFVTGRSSYSRMGLEVQLTQDLRQPGHTGQVLLQLKNNAPFAMKVYPGMRIAQLLLARLGTPCSTGYDQGLTSKYKGETDGIATKWFLDEELKGRTVISRQPQVEALLNAWLIMSALLTAASLYFARALTVASVGLLISTLVTLVLRAAVHLRSK